MESGEGIFPDFLTRFLREILPFKVLSEKVRQRIKTGWQIDYFPRNTIILEENVTDVGNLYVVQKGAVRVFTKNGHEENLLEIAAEGASFGAECIIRGGKANRTVQALENTFCLLLERAMFLQLVHEEPFFGQYYLQTFSGRSSFSGIFSHKAKICHSQASGSLRTIRDRRGESNQEKTGIGRT